MSMERRTLAEPSRRTLLKGLAAAAGLSVAPWPFAAAIAKTYSARARKIVAAAVPIDMLGLVSMNGEEWGRWSQSAEGMTAADFKRFENSGIRVFHHSYGLGGPDAYEGALKYFASLNAFISRYSDNFTRISTARELDSLKNSKKTGILPGLQNSDHFRTPADIALFHGLGQRVSQLTYNSQNRIGCGSTERHDCGISDFGVSIIEKMNEVGMLVDVSHCGDLTTLEAFEVSKKPVAITHSNCRALVDHPRLKTDEAIKKMAAAGGVMGITGVRMFVRNQEPTTIEHMADHIDHVAKLVGIEHVGIGTDSDLLGYDALPEEQNKQLRAGYKDSYAFRDKIDTDGFNHPLKMFELTEVLIRRKYSDDNIKAVLGGNFRRLLGQAWNVAKQP